MGAYKKPLEENELRIGNIIGIEGYYKSMVEVTAILPPFENQIDNHSNVSWMRVSGEGLQEIGCTCVYDCIGIDLTPEILETCGFEKDGFNAYNISISPWPDTHLKQLSFAGDYLYLREGVLEKNRITDSICVLWNNDLRGKMQLHQLQNLYFALTGEELTVDKPIHKRDIHPFMP